MSGPSAPNVSALAGAAPLFAALGDESRLRLVTRLSTEGPLSITQLSSGQAITRQAVTKHLRVLANAGVLVDSQRGRERLWQVQPQQLNQARYWLDRISEQWDEAIERLRAHVEGDEQATDRK
jgi:DNA-binding transcriptional ArsR family regulator